MESGLFLYGNLIIDIQVAYVSIYTHIYPFQCRTRNGVDVNIVRKLSEMLYEYNVHAQSF